MIEGYRDWKSSTITGSLYTCRTDKQTDIRTDRQTDRARQTELRTARAIATVARTWDPTSRPAAPASLAGSKVPLRVSVALQLAAGLRGPGRRATVEVDVEVEVDVDVDLDLDIDATTLKTFRPGGGISRERGGARQRARACGSSRSPPTPSPLPPSTHVLCPKQTGASRLLATGSQIRQIRRLES